MASSLFETCPKCGNNRLTWRIYRPAFNLPPNQMELRWRCRACDREWAEPLLPQLRDEPTEEAPLEASDV